MASIHKIGNEYRLRFFIYMPDGSKLDRSRRLDKKSKARELKAIADVLESKSKLQEYNQDDINHWVRYGLLAKRDANKLNVFPDGRKSLSQAVEEYRKTWNGISEGEIKAREGRVQRILEILGEDTPIQELRYLDGVNFINSLREEKHKAGKFRPEQSKKIKSVTINKHLQDLKRIFKIQLAQQVIEFHPFAMLDGVKVPKKEKIEHVALTTEQVQNVLRKAEEKDKKTRPPLGGKLTLFLLMFFGCGMRRKEAMMARWEHINWQTRTLKLVDTKNDHERTVGLGLRLFQMLEYEKKEKGFILPRFHKDSISRTIIRHFNHCGIKMRLHDARHTYATRLLDLGVEKRKAMTRTGHLDERMLNHYDHPEIEEIYEDQFEFMEV